MLRKAEPDHSLSQEAQFPEIPHCPSRLQLRSQHISQHSWSKTCSVGIYQEKQRIIAENLRTKLDQWMDRILNLPDLALRSAAVRRRIHNDRIIMISSADLTLYELHAVIHKPADRRTGKSGSGSILFCPVDHTLGSIHMSNRSTGSSCSRVAPPV